MWRGALVRADRVIYNDNDDNDDDNYDITAAAAAAVVSEDEDEDAVADDALCRPVYVLVRSFVS